MIKLYKNSAKQLVHFEESLIPSQLILTTVYLFAKLRWVEYIKLLPNKIYTTILFYILTYNSLLLLTNQSFLINLHPTSTLVFDIQTTNWHRDSILYLNNILSIPTQYTLMTFALLFQLCIQLHSVFHDCMYILFQHIAISGWHFGFLSTFTPNFSVWNCSKVISCVNSAWRFISFWIDKLYPIGSISDGSETTLPLSIHPCSKRTYRDPFCFRCQPSWTICCGCFCGRPSLVQHSQSIFYYHKHLLHYNWDVVAVQV